VFLYPQAYLRKYTSNLHQCFVYVTYRRSSVLLWQRSDTLCTSVLWMTSYLLIIQGCSTSTSPPSRSASSPHAALGYKQCAVIPAAGKRTHRPKSTFRALKITPQLAAHRVGVCDLLLLCFVLQRQRPGRGLLSSFLHHFYLKHSLQSKSISTSVSFSLLSTTFNG